MSSGRRRVSPDERPLEHRQAKINRNATKATLHELGFVGVDVKADTRDAILIDPKEIYEPRRPVFEAYAAQHEAYHRTDSGDWPWVVDV